MGVNSRVAILPPQYGLSVTSSTPVVLTVPQGAKTAEIHVRTASVVFTRTGIAPTATKGQQANAGDIIVLNSRSELVYFRVIAVEATATVDAEYFSDISG